MLIGVSKREIIYLLVKAVGLLSGESDFILACLGEITFGVFAQGDWIRQAVPAEGEAEGQRLSLLFQPLPALRILLDCLRPEIILRRSVRNHIVDEVPMLSHFFRLSSLV